MPTGMGKRISLQSKERVMLKNTLATYQTLPSYTHLPFYELNKQLSY